MYGLAAYADINQPHSEGAQRVEDRAVRRRRRLGDRHAEVVEEGDRESVREHEHD